MGLNLTSLIKRGKSQNIVNFKVFLFWTMSSNTRTERSDNFLTEKK